MELRGYCVSKAKGFTWNGKTVRNTAFGKPVPGWLICNNMHICTGPHSLSDLTARLCLSNRCFFMGLSFSDKNPPKLTLMTTMCPFIKKIAAYTLSGVQLLLVLLLRPSKAEVSPLKNCVGIISFWSCDPFLYKFFFFFKARNNLYVNQAAD